MTAAVTASEFQGWVAILGGLATVVLGILKYFNYRTRSERSTAAGQAFAATIDAIGSDDVAKRLAGAILLRRFFERSAEQGGRDVPYAKEAVAVIAALLREAETGTVQKLLADSLAYAPTLEHADLQECNLERAYLGKRDDRHPDLSRADFYGATLTRASLKEATARKAVFVKATLHSTIFRDACLEGADFRKADLEGARFDGAKLAGATFKGATNLPEEIRARLDGEERVPAPDTREGGARSWWRRWSPTRTAS